MVNGISNTGVARVGDLSHGAPPNRSSRLNAALFLEFVTTHSALERSPNVSGFVQFVDR